VLEYSVNSAGLFTIVDGGVVGGIGGFAVGADARLAEKRATMKKTNFDQYLEEQLQDPAMAVRLEHAGEAWDVALQIAALRQQAGEYLKSI
jgi:hypothetical protein